MASLGESEVVEVTLPNGAMALVQARQIDGGGATKTGLGRLDLEGLTEILDGVTQAVRAGLVKAAPTTVSVELGVELVVKSGKLLGLIVDGETTGSLTITLEWDRGSGSTG